MPAYKDNNTQTWYASFYYQNWKGERIKKMKRGFRTKREADEFIAKFKLEQAKDLDMNFEEFLNIYLRDLSNRIKQNTMITKTYVIEDKIKPYFKLKKINEISPADIIEWQNELLAYRDENGNPYSPCYLKTVHNQLSAIFNHAVKYYNLKNNPARIAGNMGKEKSKEMKFWTKEEYLKFSESMMRKDGVYQAFEMLYWCGLRLGDDDDKIRLNQRKPSKYKGLSRFGPEKNLQRINKFMKERPTFYKKLIQMKENFRFYLRCFYCITKVMILQFNSENRTELARNG